jgi:tetratricopeptide (TPR) repeat protein
MQAHDGLVKSLQQREGGMEILRRLYLHAPRFESHDKLPAIVRYTLLEQALNESDVSLASRLMQGLQVAPQGIEPLLWEMRRARVFVMAGEVSRGSDVLHAILDGDAILDKTATDRFMQVLFDLQTVNEHDMAYNLFEKLLNQTGDFQLQREILFWMADSRKAQEQFAEAAVLYLRSAEFPGQASPDLWAQSALYQAAEALTEANLISDARRIYSQLLSISKDEARRAVLQRRLQQLWLRENKGG